MADDLKCPECGGEFANTRLLGLHRRNRHGVLGKNAGANARWKAKKAAAAEPQAGEATPIVSAAGLLVCPLCGKEVKSLAIHLAKSHKRRESAPAEMGVLPAGPLSRIVAELVEIAERSLALAADASAAGELALAKMKPLRAAYIRERERGKRVAEQAARLGAEE